jgi:hypothetical protein
MPSSLRVSLLFLALRLRADEEIAWTRLANRYQQSGRPVGGRLVVTNQRLIFQPYRSDVPRSEPWQTSLDDVSSIGIVPPRIGPNPVRDSLWVGVDGENDGYFGVNKLKRTVQRLSDVTGTNERTPMVVPSFQPAWTRWAPQVVLSATLPFLVIAVLTQDVFADVLAAFGVIFFVTYLVRRR